MDAVTVDVGESDCSGIEVLGILDICAFGDVTGPGRDENARLGLGDDCNIVKISGGVYAM